MTRDELTRALPEDLASRDYRDEELDRLLFYAETLLKWNRAMNLVGPMDLSRLASELLSDSLRLADFLRQISPDFSGLAWDVGAGAGIPGIPLRIFWQNGSYIMIESREKRALFIAHILELLKLPRATVLRDRVEKYIKTNPVRPQCVLSRAFLPWPELLKLFAPILDGFLVILANTAPPPMDWRILGESSYPSAGKTRWIWALSPRFP